MTAYIHKTFDEYQFYQPHLSKYRLLSLVIKPSTQDIHRWIGDNKNVRVVVQYPNSKTDIYGCILFRVHRLESKEKYSSSQMYTSLADWLEAHKTYEIICVKG